MISLTRYRGFGGVSLLMSLVCLTFAFLAATNTLFARPDGHVNRGWPEPFSGYWESCGMPVRFSPTPHVSLAMRDANDQAIVILDPRLASETDWARRAFLAAHECAHHKLGHTSLQGLLARRSSSAVVLDQELSADCWAAELLGRLGHDAIVRTLSDHFYRRGLYSPGDGYPSGINRSTLIRICGAEGRRLRQSQAEP